MQLCCVTTWGNQRKSAIRKRPLDPHKSSPHDCRCQIHLFKRLYTSTQINTASIQTGLLWIGIQPGVLLETLAQSVYMSLISEEMPFKKRDDCSASSARSTSDLCSFYFFVFFFQMLRRAFCTNKRQSLRIAAASLKLAPVNRPWGKWATISPTLTMCTMKKRGN